MPLTTLSAGQAHEIVQNVIYALPPVQVMIHSTVALEISLTAGTTGFVALSTTTTGVITAARFVRCTTANATVSVKRA